MRGLIMMAAALAAALACTAQTGITATVSLASQSFDLVRLSLAAGAATGAATSTAPAPRRPKVTAYFAKGFDDAAWQKEAYDRFAKGWKPTSLPAAGKKTVVITVIAKDGTITAATEHVLSGNAAWDKAAFAAVRAADPLPPLPKTWPHATLEVHWHFETGT